MTDTYECSNCHGVFEKGWSDEEATAELGENFPGFQPTACEIVCDDCYQKIMGWAATLPEDERKRLSDPTSGEHG